MSQPERSAGSRPAAPCPRPRPGVSMVAFERVVVGTVARVSASSFTITTGAGQLVTVGRQSSTAYWKSGSPAAPGALIRGVRVAVLAASGGGSMSAAAVAVLPTQVWL